jgi:hypothetical protein
MRRLYIPAAFCAFTFAACASNPAQSAGGDCTLSAADSAHASVAPVYRDCAVDTPAKAIIAPLNFSPATGVRTAPGVTCYRAEVRFVVGVDGRPEAGTVQLVRTNLSSLGHSLLQSVPGWQYAPAVRDGVPVRQIVQESRAVASVVTVTTSGSGSPPRPPAPPTCR